MLIRNFGKEAKLLHVTGKGLGADVEPGLVQLFWVVVWKDVAEL